MKVLAVVVVLALALFVHADESISAGSAETQLYQSPSAIGRNYCYITEAGHKLTFSVNGTGLAGCVPVG